MKKKFTGKGKPFSNGKKKYDKPLPPAAGALWVAQFINKETNKPEKYFRISLTAKEIEALPVDAKGRIQLVGFRNNNKHEQGEASPDFFLKQSAAPKKQAPRQAEVTDDEDESEDEDESNDLTF